MKVWISTLALFLGVLALAIKIGAVPNASTDLILSLRVPRILLASAVGMGLAVAGATLQALFSNPLCEPYTLGISSGSALGAVIGLSLGLDLNYSGFVGTAFIGALVFTAVLQFFSRWYSYSQSSLLLIGVMLGFLGTSLVALWIAISDSNEISRVLVWLFGDLSRARWNGSITALAGVLVLTCLIWRHWREMDALLIGEEEAQALGVNVSSIRHRLILLTSFLIALCVSFAGMIGFLGLVVPHFSRRWVGSLHWRLIPYCGILGTITLVASDLLARTLVRPYELPVGVVTSLIGVPAFLMMMIRKQNYG